MKYALIALTLLTVGCSSLTQTSKEIVNAVDADHKLTSGEVKATLEKRQLTSFQQLTITHAVNDYMAMRSKWKNVLGRLTATDPVFTSFLADYAKLVKQYETIEGFTEENFSEYSEEDQNTLLEYRNQALLWDATVNRMVRAGDRYAAILAALELGKVLVNTALKL